MAAENLRQELMALAGVAEAEVDESADSPSGVRVRLEPDADARLVGVEVQRVLASHGLRSRITDQEAAAAEAVAEVPVAEAVPSIPEPSIPPPPLTPPPVVPDPIPVDPVPIEEPADAPGPAPAAEPLVEPAPEPEPVPVDIPAPVVAASAPNLGSVAVEESAAGLTITATSSDGRNVTQLSQATEEGLFEAVVSAVGTLAEGHPPTLVSVTPLSANGSQAFTVIVEKADGTKAAGAAVVKVSVGYAVGRATWAALRGS